MAIILTEAERRRISGSATGGLGKQRPLPVLPEGAVKIGSPPPYDSATPLPTVRKETGLVVSGQEATLNGSGIRLGPGSVFSVVSVRKGDPVVSAGRVKAGPVTVEWSTRRASLDVTATVVHTTPVSTVRPPVR